MPYFNVCPKCGSHLDPGERCDCIEDKPSPDIWLPAFREFGVTVETTRVAPPERAHAAPGRAWIGKPGPKIPPQ